MYIRKVGRNSKLPHYAPFRGGNQQKITKIHAYLVKERNQTLPPLGFFLAKKNPGHFSPCSDKIFSSDFFKTNSTHRDLLIPRVFE